MATTLPRRPAPPIDRGAHTVVPGGGRQRRWSLALVAVLLTLGSALAFVVLWMNAGDRKPVLAMANDVPAGEVIQENDLKVVRVSAEGGVSLVASSASDQVVGQPATTNLLAGSLLVAEAVGSDDGLDSNTSVIAVPVPEARLPDKLEQGDRVVVYSTSESGDGQPTSTPIADGRVFEVQDPDDADSGDVRVSISVDESDAPAIAANVAADSIYISKGG